MELVIGSDANTFMKIVKRIIKERDSMRAAGDNNRGESVNYAMHAINMAINIWFFVLNSFFIVFYYYFMPFIVLILQYNQFLSRMDPS